MFLYLKCDCGSVFTNSCVFMQAIWKCTWAFTRTATVWRVEAVVCRWTAPHRRRATTCRSRHHCLDTHRQDSRHDRHQLTSSCRDSRPHWWRSRPWTDSCPDLATCQSFDFRRRDGSLMTSRTRRWVWMIKTLMVLLMQMNSIKVVRRDHEPWRCLQLNSASSSADTVTCCLVVTCHKIVVLLWRYRLWLSICVVLNRVTALFAKIIILFANKTLQHELLSACLLLVVSGSRLVLITLLWSFSTNLWVAARSSCSWSSQSDETGIKSYIYHDFCTAAILPFTTLNNGLSIVLWIGPG